MLQVHFPELLSEFFVNLVLQCVHRVPLGSCFPAFEILAFSNTSFKSPLRIQSRMCIAKCVTAVLMVAHLHNWCFLYCPGVTSPCQFRDSLVTFVIQNLFQSIQKPSCSESNTIMLYNLFSDLVSKLKVPSEYTQAYVQENAERLY
jgi:hypothetical protein